MTYPISKLEGMTPQAADKLKREKIRTIETLLDRAGDAKQRKALAARTGISEAQLLDWVNIAAFMDIKGVSTAKAGLFRKAGVNTVREFALRNPQRLAQAMKEANDKHRLVRVMPSERSIARLIQTARKLPPKITY
jgi:predicted RecB family nuclease